LRKLEKIASDPEVGVVVIDFGPQQIDPPQRSFQPLGGPHDPDVVPHEEPQLIPVVGDDDLLVGVLHPAFVPRRECRACARRLRDDPGGTATADDDAFEE
jgi:hypothetical protein